MSFCVCPKASPEALPTCWNEPPRSRAFLLTESSEELTSEMSPSTTIWTLGIGVSQPRCYAPTHLAEAPHVQSVRVDRYCSRHHFVSDDHYDPCRRHASSLRRDFSLHP